MSRTVSADIKSAIEEGVTYNASIYARLLPSRIFYTSITDDNPMSSPDAVGFPDTPVAQDIGYSSGSPASPTVYTYVNESGALRVYTNGNGTGAGLGETLTGKPGVCDDTLFRISGGDVYKHTISYGPVSLGGGTNIGTPSETPLHVHGVSATRCVYLSSGSGGIRAGVIDGTTVHESPERFMFPSFIEMEGSDRTMDNLALYSGALQLSTKTFVYITSLSGVVQSAYWDEDTEVWSDIFTAVPTQLDVSMCEFRVANAFEHGGVAYLAGQFKRTENVETDKFYNMVLRSEDGKSFSIDRFSSVSELGYRFLATVGNDNYFYLSNCNRVCYSEVTYNFDGNNDNGLKIVIPEESVLSFSNTNEQGNITLKAGDENLLFHPYVEEGNKMEIYLTYETTSGSQGDLYGTYIIDGKGGGIRDGSRGLSLSLMSEGHWKLQTHTSPYYTEFFGKSSLFDDLTEESGNLDPAPLTTLTKTKFFVDFWQSEQFVDSANGVDGVDVLNSGGVDCYPLESYIDPILIGAHKLGVKTKDLKSTLGLSDYPEITGTTVDVEIHGWSHPWATGENADIAEVCFIVIHEDGTEENIYTNEDTRFSQTWPDVVAGEDPVAVTVTGLVAGDKIKSIAVIFESNHSTQFYIARVEVLTNIVCKYTFDDPNTPWAYSTSGSGFEIPGMGRPYIMFMSKPFNAFNFTVAASFEHTVQGPISTHPTAVGLLGHAEDGNNCVMGRYNRSNNKLEIVKVREGIETVLTDGTPSSGSPGEMVDLLFKHRDGHYMLYMPDAGVWTEELAYDWQDTDGFMFTSETVTMKCGIYGFLSAPSFKTAGFNMQAQETGETNVDGIVHLPLEDITDFPASGEVKVDDNVYSYASKLTPPAKIRGPYQLRQNNLYSAPYGNGMYGLETREFLWNASWASVRYKLISVGGGSTFYIDRSDYTIFIKTLGTIYWLRQRSRHYSQNSQIGTLFFSLSNKCFTSGGLKDIALISGKATKHPEGELCQLNMTGNVYCHWVYGAGGDDDVTVEDLIEKISSHAGVKTEFPGDVTVASQAVGSGYKVSTVDYRDGFDLLWEAASAGNFTVEADVSDPRYSGDTQTKITLVDVGGGDFRLEMTSEPSGDVIEKFEFVGGTQAHRYRVLYFDNFISCYIDGKWIHTFAVPELVYDISNDVYLGGNFTALNIRLKDLCDWREAIYIDLETDAMSSIGSVIQERPIETIWRANGGTSYWYDLVRDTINQIVQPNRHKWDETTPKNGASDAIVYGYSDVKCLQYQPYHENYGFATKVMRFPNLKSGALKAAKVVLEREYETRMSHTVDIRPDLRLEVGDILAVSYNASATNTAMAMDVIIESLTLNVTEKGTSMTVGGREDV